MDQVSAPAIQELHALRAVAVQARNLMASASRVGLPTINLDASLMVLARAVPFEPVEDRTEEVSTLRLRFAEIVRVTDTDATHPAKTDECARIARAALARDPIVHPTGRR